MHGEQLRARLKADQVILNLSLSFYSPSLVEILGYSDVDTIFLDAEHGPFNEAQCEDLVRTADLAGKPVLIRVPNNEDHVILRYLDIGTTGLIIPRVTTADDARRAVAAVKYGPQGHRSFASPRAASYGLRESSTDYIARANRETVVIGLFEDIRGLENLPEILAVEGLDALIIGPYDLSFSMGHPAQPGHPEVQRVIDQVIAACRAAGKATGLPAGDATVARQHVERGCRIISLSFASFLVNATRDFSERIRKI